MSTKTEVENLKTSGAEKVLAVVLAAFILVGAIWTYDKIGEIAGGSDEYGYSSDIGYQSRNEARSQLSADDQQALAAEKQATRAVGDSRRAVKKATARAVLARENWRAELDAGLAAGEELAAYRQAQVTVEATRRILRADQQQLAASRPAANAAQRNLREELTDVTSQQERKDLIVFLLRLTLIGGMLGGGYSAMSRIRQRRSRLLPLALADIGAATVLALYMAGDYGSDWAVFDDVGPLMISLIGITLTVVAFVLLQRYLARRIPLRRVRRHECPFCGYPAGENSNCEGCGRRLLGECSTCHEPRRVGTPRCGSCGEA